MINKYHIIYVLNSISGLLKTALLTALSLLANGCAEYTTQTLRIDSQAPFISAPIISPVPNTATEQRLVAFPDGKVMVAWWENLPGTKGNLQISAWENDSWSPPIPVSTMPNIVDAEFAPIGNDHLAAMWMASKPYQAGGEVQGIYTSTTDSSNNRWSTPLKVNQEKQTSGKTLPALAAFANGSLLTAWIDMPVTQPNSPGSPKEITHSEPASSLTVALISADNSQVKSMPAVKEFCGCCPPALAIHAEDGFLAYRGLLPANIRDPAIMRIGQDKLNTPHIIHNDHWEFDGCPSSGPVLAVLKNTVAVAWTTLINNRLIVRTAFSQDNGDHFAVPIDVELDNATGVSGIALESPQSALLVWTGIDTKGSAIKLARVYADGRIEHRTTVHRLTNDGTYKWPGPRMVKTNHGIIIGWNDEQSKKLGLVKVKLVE